MPTKKIMSPNAIDVCRLVQPWNAISGRANKLHEYAVPAVIVMTTPAASTVQRSDRGAPPCFKP